MGRHRHRHSICVFLHFKASVKPTSILFFQGVYAFNGPHGVMLWIFLPRTLFFPFYVSRNFVQRYRRIKAMYIADSSQ
jgi:hypothetical protein